MGRSAPYFPFYADDWLDDQNIFDMGLECEGAYIRLLSAMWKREGYIPDQSNWCCNILRCKPAKWKKIRLVLIDSGVIILENERLFNQRLLKELLFFNEKSQKNVRNAHKRWSEHSKNNSKNSNKINESSDAVAMQSQCHTNTDTNTNTDKDLESKDQESMFSYKNVIDLYHSELPELPKSLKISNQRKSRINQLLKSDLPDKENWVKFFRKISDSDFLMGRSKDWSCKLDWIINPTNALKISEGNYDNKTNGRSLGDEWMRELEEEMSGSSTINNEQSAIEHKDL